MKAANKSFYDFGEFRLDTEKHRLLRDGEIIAITPKAVETLNVLIQNRGRVVERDELLNRVWPDVAVEDGNLTVTISMLRKALGESNGRKFIETAPRLGYKFVADVREVTDQGRALILERQTSGRIVIDEEITLGRFSLRDAASRFSRRRLAAVASAAIIVTVGVLTAVQRWKSNPANPNIRSIAILPIKSLGQNPNDDSLSLGFADALMTSLGRVNGVRVLSANAVSHTADLQQEPIEIGKQLAVDSVLDGTLQRANGKLRVTLRILRTSDGSQIWSGSFDEAESEIFRLQDAMAAQTAQSLKWSIGANQQQVARRYSENREAYESYLRGRFFFDKRTSENYEKAVADFQKAISLDPNYALAYTGLADVYALQANSRSSGSERDELYEKSRAHATKALELDESLAEAHTSLGWIKRIHDWDWAGSEREFRRALELNPNHVNAHQWYALLLVTLGRRDEAIREIEKAREFEPLSTIVLQNYFAVQQYVRKSEGLVVLAEQIIKLDSSESVSVRLLPLAHLRNGNEAKVIELGEGYFASHPREPIPAYLAMSLAIAYARTGQQNKAAEMIDLLIGRSKTSTESAYRLAAAYATMQRKDEALALLQRCLDAHDDRLVWLKVEPHFDELRDDARFQKILRQMNL